MVILAIVVIVLGLVVLLYGTRLALFGAGVGALLGIWLLNILPGDQSSLLWAIVPVGLAILFALGASLAKVVIGIITLVLGALGGWAVVMGVLGLFGWDLGLISWILAFIGAVVGAILFSRFKEWAVIFLASIVGALLVVRGLQMWFPSFQGWLASLIGLLLAGGGIAYHAGWLGGKKPAKQ
jgi:hypothetical protein